MNINVLNKNLERVGIVMQYTSLIWVKRYVKNGDCELYLPATTESIELLKKGYYLTRDDDDMVCVIRKIEITTGAEDANMLIVTGVDVRCLLDQRIQQVPGKFTNVVAETAIRSMVAWAVINTGADGDVTIMYKANGQKLVTTTENSALTNRITTEYGYGNAGDKIREVQKTFGWGGRMFLDRTNVVNPVLNYETYKGTDRRSTVRFSPAFYTLKSSDYVDDMTPMKNVTYEVCKLSFDKWSQDYYQYYGTATGTDRFEQIIDRRSNSCKMTKAQIESNFPGGTWEQQATNVYLYNIPSGWQFVVPPGSLQTWLQTNYSGLFTFTTSAGVTTATSTIGMTLARADVTTLTSTTEASLTDVPFFLYILGLAKEDNTKHPEEITFTADVVPDLTYKYKEDYDIGDIVTIENEYGISAAARIMEVLEAWDSNGYTLELKFDE